jgi:hypothetical protein
MKREEEKKEDRICCCKKTKIRLKKFQVNNDFKNYDKAINYLLDKFENRKPPK